MAGLDRKVFSDEPEDYKGMKPSNPTISEFHHIPLMWLSYHKSRSVVPLALDFYINNSQNSLIITDNLLLLQIINQHRDERNE